MLFRRRKIGLPRLPVAGVLEHLADVGLGLLIAPVCFYGFHVAREVVAVMFIALGFGVFHFVVLVEKKDRSLFSEAKGSDSICELSALSN